MKVLGFDVSSQNIGWAVLEKTGNNFILLKYGVYQPPKKGTIFQRLLHTKKWLVDLLLLHKPSKIFIEDIIQFMGGGSTAKTIISLTSFNRLVGLTCLETCALDPTMMSVQTVRAKLKKLSKSPTRIAKADVAKTIEKILNINFPWIYKKNGVLAPSNADLADAIAVAIAGAF